MNLPNTRKQIMDTKSSNTVVKPIRFHRTPCSLLPAPRRAFTLVELLVVITIIAILAALVTVAAAAALRKAQATRIKTEIDQISTALETYKDKAGSFPPNSQTDGSGPLDDNQVFTDLKRHMKQAFGRHRESDALLRALAGLATGDTTNYPNTLAGGMTAGEAVVFWLGGFSSDPEYPISGEGGPSYRIDNVSGSASEADPLDSRKWIFPFEVTRLKPRLDTNYFDEAGNRFIEYQVNVNGTNQRRRINFWQYVPAKSTQPFLYFDVSRHPAAVKSGSNYLATFDPPASTPTSSNPLEVHAFKKAAESAAAASPIDFVNAGKFQVLHSGIDDQWGEFEKVSVEHDPTGANLVLFPNGPFTGELADTSVNFISQTKIEDAQP
jgi:prepilin-type N-terminal cleavage/methylation domain-containing protein